MRQNCRENDVDIPRKRTPLSRGVLESKGGGKMTIHYCADFETITTVFRTITSVNQISLYGAVAEMCEEYMNPFMIERGNPLWEDG